MRKKLVFLAGAALAAAFLGRLPEAGPISRRYSGLRCGGAVPVHLGAFHRGHGGGAGLPESVETFNEAYNGRYFADIEFVPRNDSGGGYSDKINASVMAGGLPDVLTVDGPNVAAYAANNIIQPWRSLRRRSGESICPPSLSREPTTESSMHWG